MGETRRVMVATAAKCGVMSRILELVEPAVLDATERAALEWLQGKGRKDG